jgi:hypothetical protein
MNIVMVVGLTEMKCDFVSQPAFHTIMIGGEEKTVTKAEAQCSIASFVTIQIAPPLR